MPVTIDGTNGITTPTYGGTDTSEYLVPVTAFKNRIINGAMMIDQRNAGAAVTLNNSAFQYTVDRWAALTALASSSTVTAQRISTGISAFPNALRILRGSGTYSSNVMVVQEVETLNCQDLAGQTVTVSFWLRKGSAFSGTGFYVQGISGSGSDQGIVGANSGTWTNWAAPVLGNVTSSSISTSFTQFSFTWTVPAGTNEIAIYGVVNTFSGTGSANDFIDITGVQLEKGSTATSFDYRPYGTELALCQRYYWRNVAGASYGCFGTGVCGSSTNVSGVNTKLPVTMRSVPTVGFSSIRLLDGTAANVASAISYQSSSTDTWSADFTGSGLTTGRAGVAQANNSTSAYIDASSEL